ncbi:MAG: DEAD/DEAH box helicase [Chloroflexota bacterium]|nr:MAG: DEAD/DEAH box helicase [Chloroflexota bacterium]
MNVAQYVEHLRANPAAQANITSWRTLPAREPTYGEWPRGLNDGLVRVLEERGIRAPYSHQASAIEAAIADRDVVVITPTASGKTLCYNVPVVDAILRDPEARALYLFPTKALAQDQLSELHGLVEALGADIRTFTYDGDTPAPARKAIRSAGHIVITNPDMLHTGILPHHTGWTHLFSKLRYVVIDEMHYYRGVFGSHLANVLRRLRRVCAHYGANPTFILSSATIANPADLARALIEKDVIAIEENGAPRAEKHVIFYNPPVVNRQLGIRASSVLTARRVAADLIGNHIQTILFARSRLTVEILTTYLRDDARKRRIDPSAIRGYRGGYLPTERRTIERGLRDGSIAGVVSTNALELGIDIGSLDACVMVGYPGTIASTWQQAGRAGRRGSVSLAIMVATSAPIDQFIVNHPDYFFDHRVESGLINPNNLLILMSHLKCGAFELPFSDGDRFGDPGLSASGRFGVEPSELLNVLEEERVLHRSGQRWYWSTEKFPADEISLRSASIDNFVIVDETDVGNARLIGEMDRIAVPTMLHEDAIYIHQGQQHEVTRLDWDNKKAYVRRVDVDYYTDADLAADLSIIDVAASRPAAGGERSWGEVALSFKATIFKKIKFDTHENVGWGKIHLPVQDLHTTAYWFAFDDARATISDTALQGVASVIANVAPIYLMCDPRDIGVHHQTRAPFTGKPTIFVYDSVPGGVGFAEKLYAMHDEIVAVARAHLETCACIDGCPSCVGPWTEIGRDARGSAIALLDTLTSAATAIRA